MIQPLPKNLVDSGPDPSGDVRQSQSNRDLLRFASDVIDFLRFLPTFEVKTFGTRAEFPIKSLEIETDVANVTGVVVLKAEEAADEGATVVATGVSWERAADGLKIKSIGGLSAGTDYTVTVLVLGDR